MAPALPGLDAAAIERLAGDWSDRGLWVDVAWLARRFWASGAGGDRRLAWHHLLLAVGNFKRDGNRRLHPARLNGLRIPPVKARRSFGIPGTDPVVKVGYVQEAVHRQAWPAGDGTFLDGIGYAMLRSDWEDGTITPVDWSPPSASG